MRYTPRHGFTLIEMMVSVGLFAIVMLIATGALFKLLSLDRQVRATNDVVDNLNFAVDSMEREIQTGTSYGCGAAATNCPSGGPQFQFQDYLGRYVIYLFVQPSGSVNGYIGRCASKTGWPTCNSTNAVPFTDSRINIQKVTFYVNGIGTTDTVQPQVLFTINGTMQSDPSLPTISFSLENYATQRFLEL